jgi:hypothetical protein
MKLTEKEFEIVCDQMNSFARLMGFGEEYRKIANWVISVYKRTGYTFDNYFELKKILRR